jgi:histidine triad (HIT) family protein
MATDCLFCKIVAGAIPCKHVYEDDLCLCFEDIAPKATVHLLLIPKKHISSHAHMTEEDAPLLGHLMLTAMKVAEERGLQKGYRTVINTGPDGGQTVDHLHLHILGGRHMTWPPG